MGFDTGDASGWDECVPSVAACRVGTESGIAEIPDHGDLWRVEWTEGPGTGDQGVKTSAVLNLVGRCFSLPLELQRTLELQEIGESWRLKLQYKLKNTGSKSLPWSWAAHPLFAVEEGDRIVLPETVQSLRLEGSAAGRLGKGGDAVAWPMARLSDGSQVDMRIAAAPDSRIAEKLFSGLLKSSENWCALERPSASVRIRVTFDAEATPYLGLWICYGGWPERRGPKQVSIALEPSTAPVDSLAETGPWSRVLEPGGCFSWPMSVDLELI
jgi:galactose mutarotase-like enzyme